MIPARLARRLVERRGRLGAIRAVANRLDRYRVYRNGEPIITNPTRWLVWGTVLGIVLGIPQPHVVDWLPALRQPPVRLNLYQGAA